MTVTTPAASLPLSRPFLVDTVLDGGSAVTVEATPAERDALRAFNKLAALDAFKASLLVRAEGRDGLRVTGEVTAEVVQTCVVTLEAFPTAVREPVDVHFLQPAALERWRAERAKVQDEAEGDGSDEPDAIVAGRIDLGALAAEHLTLALDPYPRKPGVRLEDVLPPAVEEDASPFAALKALRPGGA